MNFTLRRWKQSDIENVVKHANNYNVARYLTNAFPHPYTSEDSKAYIELVANENPAKVFAIDVGGYAVGSIGIFQQTDVHCKNAEIGYWLSEEYWGQGIMSEAIKQMVEYGFKTFDITRIFARPFGINAQSHKALLKAGFIQEAVFKNTIFKNNEFYDEVFFVVYKPEK